MDPNTALEQARKALQTYNDESVDADTAADAASQIASAFEGLDEWLSRGGFPPDAWQRAS